MLQRTETKELLTRYWQEFNSYLVIKCSKLPKSNNTHNTWCNFALGTSLGTLEAVINTKGSNRVELRIHGTRAQETYRKIETMHEHTFRQQIAQAIFDPMPECILKCIYVEQHADIFAREDWPRQFEWLMRNLETFYCFFQPKLKNLYN